MGAILDHNTSFASQIESTAEIPAPARIRIYSEAYRLRLLEALEENFPGLAHLLGDQQFELLGRDYIRHYPSNFKSIRWFGDQLPLYVQGNQPWASNPMLHEMALADWTMTMAFDAPDQQPADVTAMASIAPELWGALRFQFHPSVHRLDLYWSVIPFRGIVEQAPHDAAAPERGEYPTAWLIWRKTLRQLYRSMEVDEAWSIDQARSGATFGSLCEGLTEWVEPHHAASRAASFLKQWLLDELIVDISIEAIDEPAGITNDHKDQTRN